MLQFGQSRNRKQGLEESGLNLSLIKRWSRRNGVFELTPRKTRSWENSAELKNIETKTGWLYVKFKTIHSLVIYYCKICNKCKTGISTFVSQYLINTFNFTY